MTWTKETLWELRKQIRLNSLYVSDYENTLGIDPKHAMAFFDGYVAALEETAEFEHNEMNVLSAWTDYDSPDELYGYYCDVVGAGGFVL